ncbi:hypothetical protein BOO91_14765 [Vibrio navarrensis]|uniref:tetratricopeptide repeat protein n=1 Tax=Vibrio navarrensis TaxID=29495 RepID=UPI001866F1E5|nr:tetratricopeptide repeat protein [Vibrio navarrensis]MBE3662193.1 hypothetical protein [Vibrio navarrensis]
MNRLLALILLSVMVGCASDIKQQDTKIAVTPKQTEQEVALTPDEIHFKAQELYKSGETERAAKLLVEAGNLKSPAFFYNMGLSSLIENDLEYAFIFFNEAADVGHADASYQAGLLVEGGHVSYKHPISSVIWYLKSSELGNYDAREKISDMMKDTSYSRSLDAYDYHTVMAIAIGKHLKEFPQDNTPEQISDISSSIVNAEDFFLNDKDRLMAIKNVLFSKEMLTSKELASVLLEAEAGNSRLFLALAQFYERHHYKTKYLYWMGRHAESGTADDKVDYAYKLLDENRESEAFEWATLALEQNIDPNNDWAGLLVAELYLNGKGTQQDTFKAIGILNQLKTADALERLGEIYAFGIGVPVNDAIAVKYFSQAAKLGSNVAQHNLAVHYYSGEGVPQNYKMAYVWHSVASANNYKHSNDKRDSVAEKLDKLELSDAQKIASEYFEKYVVPFRD